MADDSPASSAGPAPCGSSAGPEVARSERSRPPRSSSMRILVIEDNADTRDMLKMLLMLWGHDVRVADAGPQGVQIAGAFRPEVAVIDIGLPGLDGFEVARPIRSQLGSGVRLIALTAYGQIADRQRSVAAGFDVHLVKPCPS